MNTSFQSITLLVAMFLSAFVGQAKINPGEIVILGFESSTGQGAVEEAWFMALAPIDPGEVVYFTDCEISATAPFNLITASGDSWLSFTVGPNGLNVGDTWIIGDLGTATPSITSTRSSVDSTLITNILTGNTFTLSFGQNGDDMILYQGTSTTAVRFIYGVGADPLGGGGVSQFEPTTPANQTKMANWGLTPALTANFFDNGNSNYKLLGVQPGVIDFNGDIDAILTQLGQATSYVYDVAYVLNDAVVDKGVTYDLTLGTVSPQPINRFYNAVDGQWYTDAAFTTLAIDPNRTHTVVVVTTSFDVAANDTLDVAGIIVGDSVTATTVQALDGSVVQTVYGVQVTNNGTFVMQGAAQVYLGANFDVNAGGTASLEPGAHLDFEGDLIVNGTMTLEADSTGYSSLGLQGTTAQNITGTGTINAQFYFAHPGWHHLSAPGSISFQNVSFTNGMNLTFSGAGRNIYRWNAAPATTGPGWYPTQSTSDFGDSSFAVYFFAANIPSTATLSYVADDMDADIVGGTHSIPIRHKVPTGNPVNSTLGWVGNERRAALNGGWNLTKNPYWGHLSWQAVDDNLPANVNSAVYFWKPRAGMYESWVDGEAGENYDITPLLAHFFKASSAGNAINKAQSHVFNGSANHFGKVGNVKPQLQLFATAEGKTARLSVIFDDEATDRFDGRYDALYRLGNPDQVVFNVVSSDSIALQTEQRPFPLPQSTTYLSYNYAMDGAASKIALDPTYLPNGVYAYLEDLHTNVIVDLRAGDYTFTHDANAPVQRFKLHLNNTAVSVFEFNTEENPLQAFASAEGYTLRGDLEDGSYMTEVYDVSGRVIFQSEIEFSAGQAQLPIELSTMGIIRVWNGSEVLSVKTI